MQLNFSFILKGNVGGSVYMAQEAWAGREFQRTTGNISINLQPFKWLTLHNCYSFGDGIYYDPQDPYLGKRQQMHLNFTLQPNRNINLFGEYSTSTFKRVESSERVYSQEIWRGRLTYQFSPKLFVRALVQYDSFYNKVLGDFLASFTYIPGTVIYLGYGTLNESQAWVNGRWQRDVTGERYFQTRQSLFFKVSYRYQF